MRSKRGGRQSSFHEHCIQKSLDEIQQETVSAESPSNVNPRASILRIARTELS